MVYPQFTRVQTHKSAEREDIVLKGRNFKTADFRTEDPQ